MVKYRSFFGQAADSDLLSDPTYRQLTSTPGSPLQFNIASSAFNQAVGFASKQDKANYDRVLGVAVSNMNQLVGNPAYAAYYNWLNGTAFPKAVSLGNRYFARSTADTARFQEGQQGAETSQKLYNSMPTEVTTWDTLTTAGNQIIQDIKSGDPFGAARRQGGGGTDCAFWDLGCQFKKNATRTLLIGGGLVLAAIFLYGMGGGIGKGLTGRKKK